MTTHICWKWLGLTALTLFALPGGTGISAHAQNAGVNNHVDFQGRYKIMRKQHLLIALGVALIVLVLSLGVFQNVVGVKKPFKDVRIVFFNGGPQGDPFATVVHNGAKSAADDLGANVEYVWSDWDPRKMSVQFKEAIDRSPDGICMMGHPGGDVLRSLVDEAIRKGIIVTLQNVDIPDLRKGYVDKGLGYVGQDLYSSGKMLGAGVVRKFEAVRGREALVIGPGITEDKQALNERAMRTKGIIDALEKEGLVVHAMPLPLEVEKSPTTAGVDLIANALARYPNTRVIITDHGPVTGAMGIILKKLGRKPGELVVAGFDLSQNTVEAIQEGYVALVHDQQPFLEGYLPILQVCLTKEYGFSGLYIDTGVGLVDKSNIDAVAELARRQLR